MLAGWMRRTGSNGAEGARSTDNAQHRTAGPLRIGPILAAVGCALLGASVVDLSTSTFAARAGVEAIRDVSKSWDISIVVISNASHCCQARPQAASQGFGRAARGNVRVEPARDTRPEFTDVATIAAAQDPREALVVMAAAAQHRGRMMHSCACSMDVRTDHAGLINSDDRIANALFGPGSDAGIPPQDWQRFRSRPGVVKKAGRRPR